MKRRLLTLMLLFCILPFADVMAQEFMPFYNSPYAGVTGVQINPASIAGSRYKFDVTVFGASAGVHNDLLTFSRKKIIFNPHFHTDMWSKRSDFWNADLSQDTRNMLKHYTRNTAADWGNSDYGGYFGAQLDVLHLMYSFNDRFTMAVGYSMRAFNKANRIPEGIAAAALGDYVGNRPPVFTGSNAYTNSADINTTMFQQVALSGAYTLLNNENHKLKLGATAKLIFSGKTFFAHADNFTANYTNGSITAINGEAGKSTNGSLGFAGDFGVEYEYQPAELKGNEIAEYRVKIGASLLDVGSFKSKDATYRRLAPGAGMPNGANDFLALYGGASLGNEFTTSLPMVFTGQIDYNIGNGLFVNFTPYIAFNQTSAHSVSKFTSFNLIPHYELKNFGVSVPIQYDQYGKFTAGVGFRAWKYLWVGSNTLLKNLWPGTNSNYSADFHIMVKVPIEKVKKAPPMPVVEEVKPVEQPKPAPVPVVEPVVEPKPEPVVVAKVEGIKNVEFDIDKFNIRPEFMPELERVLKMLNDDPNATLTIVGHTDNTFTRPYNMQLSKRRAESVKSYFVKNKINAKRIKTLYFGPDKPIESNDTAEGRQKNRRAEITLEVK